MNALVSTIDILPHEAVFEQNFLGTARSHVPRRGKILDKARKELGVLGREDHVHGGCQHPPSEYAIAVHHGYGRLGQFSLGQCKIDIQFSHLLKPPG